MYCAPLRSGVRGRLAQRHPTVLLDHVPEPGEGGRVPGPADDRLMGGIRQPKKTSASAYRSGGTSLSVAVASASGTLTISVPRSATMLPNAPSATALAAWTPNRVARTRSNAVGVPPR